MRLVDRVAHYCDELGLTLSVKKTQTNGWGNCNVFSISIGGEMMDAVADFMYIRPTIDRPLAQFLLSCPSHNVLPLAGACLCNALSLWPDRQTYRPRLVGGPMSNANVGANICKRATFVQRSSGVTSFAVKEMVCRMIE